LLRLLPHFKGKFRLVRLLFSKKLQTAKNITVKGRHGLQYYLPNLEENIAFEIFADGIYEKETTALIIERLPANAVWLDIGANIGSITMPVCVARPDAKVICAEASSNVFAYLRQNILINKLKNCILINKAVSDSSNEEVEFFNPGNLFGKGAMASSFAGSSEKIRTITIDSLLEELEIPEIDFIKIDIEGYEYFAFKGAEKTLLKINAPDILFEFLDCAETADRNLSPGDAQKLLMHYGYNLYRIEKHNRLVKQAKALEKGEAMIFATKKNA
jgi:FkbM family methyltransferase